MAEKVKIAATVVEEPTTKGKKQEKRTMASAVLPCACNSWFQDRTYGAHKRLHTPVNKSVSPRYRCTICSTEH